MITEMYQYNPHKKPDPETWLTMDDEEKLDLVEEFHRNAQIEIEGMTMHAVIHVVIENQLAMKIPEVLVVYQRLRQKNVNRHNAIHALGNAMSNLLFDHFKGKIPEELTEMPEPNKDYFRRLKKLRASDWKK